MAEPDRGPHGLLVVDKPPGVTSFSVVAEARRRFRTRSVGHAGTLDPMATGVLLLLFGEGTKLAGHLTLASKSYEATVELGRSTDTLDALGTTTHCWEVPQALDVPALQHALERERARTAQLPPQFSAIKRDGVRSYALARKGEAVELEERPVRVEQLILTEASPDAFRVSMRVSKGYYVRSFARDVCEHLALPGHLSALRRVDSGGFSLSDAVSWPPPEGLTPITVAEAARRALPWATLTSEGVTWARHGKVLEPAHFETSPEAPGTSAWFTSAGTLVALGEPASESTFRVVRGFRNSDSDSVSERLAALSVDVEARKR